MCAFFSRVFPMGSLRLFCGDELQELFGSDQGVMDWNPEQLLHVFKFEHGYVPVCRTRVLSCSAATLALSQLVFMLVRAV